MITDEMIKQLCVKHGYQLKSIKNGQPDLGAYVYAAARELIALAAAPEVKGEPVAWVDVPPANNEKGYTFYGIQLLPEGKHHLFLHPPADLVERIRALDCASGSDRFNDGYYKAKDDILALIEGAR